MRKVGERVFEDVIRWIMLQLIALILVYQIHVHG